MSFNLDSHVLASLKDRIDIIDVISSYIQVKKAGRNYLALCPFHNEKSPSFNINADKQFFHCFGCGKSGDAITFVREYENLEFVDAVSLLADKTGFILPEKTDEQKQKIEQQGYDRKTLIDIHEETCTWFEQSLQSPNAAHVREYLQNRAVTNEDITKFRIGYAPDGWDNLLKKLRLKYNFEALQASGLFAAKEVEGQKPRLYDRFRDRLMFAICNDEGRVIAFSGRVLDKEAKGAKYVNSPETPIFHKSRILFGLNHARRNFKKHDYALICEGQLDVIACHRAGLDNAISCQGTAFTVEHARKLKRYCDHITLAFDADNAGQKAAIKSLDALLEVGITPKVVGLQPGEDPDSLYQNHGAEKLNHAIEQAEDFFQHMLRFCSKNEKDPRSPQGRASIVQQIIEQLVKLKNPLVQDGYVHMIASQLQMPDTLIYNELKKTRLQQNKLEQRTQERQENRQAPAPVAATPFPPREEILKPSELSLLDICLNFEDIAEELSDEIAPHMLSNTPAGRALKQVLNLAMIGEWSSAFETVREQYATTCKPIALVLMNPHYTKDTPLERLQQAMNESLRSLKLELIQEEINDIILQLKLQLPQEERTRLMHKQMQLFKDKREI